MYPIVLNIKFSENLIGGDNQQGRPQNIEEPSETVRRNFRQDVGIKIQSDLIGDNETMLETT